MKAFIFEITRGGDLLFMQETSTSQGLSRIFTAWGRIIGRLPRAVVALCLVLSALVIVEARDLTFDTSFESFLAPDHPTRVALDRFRDQFGRGEPVVIAVPLPGRVADPVFLRRLEALHEDLEANVLYLERITSLVNVRATRTEGPTLAELSIGELLAEWPEDAAELDALEEFVRSSALYENYLVGSAKGGDDPSTVPLAWTAIILEAQAFAEDAVGEGVGGLELEGFDDADVQARRLNSADDSDMLATVRAILSRHRTKGFEVELAGSLVVGEVVGQTVKSDFGRLLGLACLAIGALLYGVFRRISLCLLVLSVVLVSLAGCLGCMAFAGEPVGFGTQILPAFLLAAGVGYAVHVVTLFRYYLAEGARGGDSAPGSAVATLEEKARKSTRSERATAIETALDHAGAPIFLTAVTTMGGLLSFVPSQLAPIAQLGVFAPLGIGLAAIYSLVLLPGLLVLLPMEKSSATTRCTAPTARVEEWVVRCGLFASERPLPMLAGLAVVVVASLLGATRLESSHNPLAWLPGDAEIAQSTRLVDRELGGASVLELLIESREPGGFKRPELLSRLDALERSIVELDAAPIVVGKVTGLHNVVKELNQSLSGDRPEAYVIPADERLVAQELILFENSGMDDVEQLVDSTYTTARVSIRVNQLDAFYAIPFASQVESLARAGLGDLAEVEMTGIYELKNSVFVEVIDSLKTSYTIAFVMIGILLVLMVGDLKIGLASLIPNTAPVLVALGMMGWLGIPLGVYTLLVGSIAMGLAVDDTIHMAHSYVRFERDGETPRRAIAKSLSTAGVAVLFTSAALLCGFLIFGLATLSALLQFGLVTAVAILTALVADLLISPALFVWVGERRHARLITNRDEHRAPSLGVPSEASAIRDFAA